MSQENQVQPQESNESEVKPVAVAAAPRHVGKTQIKKPKSFADIQAQKQIDGVKLWSNRVLEAQLESKACSKEMKAACKAELEARAESRKKKESK